MQKEQEQKQEQKPYVVQIDGGIGRVICAIPALEKLSQKKKVTVLTSYPEVFFKNPHVFKAYNLSREYLWDDVIKHGEFFYPEPYYNHLYYNQDHHLIQSFNLLLTGEAGDVTPSTLYLTEEEKEWATEFVATRKQETGKKIVLLQCFGSGARFKDDKISDSTHRSLSSEMSMAICTRTDHTYINASHIKLNFPNVWQQDFTTRQLIALSSACDFIVGVDSAIMHMGAAFNKTGVIFFGSTFPQNLGYPCFKNIQRESYPKNYTPNRFSGFVDENSGALDFSEPELEGIIATING